MLFILLIFLLPWGMLVAATPVNVTQTPPQSIKKPLPNYYWRKYEGVIPHDAVPGGHTPSGEQTYIGQVLLLEGLDAKGIIPGVIHPGQTEVVAVFDKAYRSKGYNTILCSDTPSALKWRTVNEQEIYLVHHYLVVGGYEVAQNAYIGRVSYANHLIVGKVFTESNEGLRIATPDGTRQVFTSFEVLVYDR